jgi:hypothetical protein
VKAGVWCSVNGKSSWLSMKFRDLGQMTSSRLPTLLASGSSKPHLHSSTDPSMQYKTCFLRTGIHYQSISQEHYSMRPLSPTFFSQSIVQTLVG